MKRRYVASPSRHLGSSDPFSRSILMVVLSLSDIPLAALELDKYLHYSMS